MDPEELDTTKLEEEVAKAADEARSESTTGPKQKIEEQEVSQEDSPSAETLKTDKEEIEKQDDDESRFDKHPRFVKLLSERDTYKTEAESLRDLKKIVGDIPAEEIVRFRDGASLLRKHPELAEKVQELIDKYDYTSGETKNLIQSVKDELTQTKEQLVLDKYDNIIQNLMTQYKVDKDDSDMIKEFLDNRVLSKRISLNDVPKEFESILMTIDKMRRKQLASYIKERGELPKVPSSPAQKGKVMTTKKDSADAGDIVDGLAEDLRKARGDDFVKE